MTRKSAIPLVCDAVIDCVSTAHTPTAVELDMVAERIWSESRDTRLIFRWGDVAFPHPSGPARCVPRMRRSAATTG